MKAIIMAGGEGSRLRPLTCDCPKPMLRLMDKPLMEYAVRLLKQHGVHEIAATLGYLPDAITDYFGDGASLGVSLRFHTEKTPLGTAGSILQAASFLDERFYVLSGDGITDFDLSAALRFHLEKGALATLILKKSAAPQEYGMVVTDADGRIRAFHEKPGRSDVYSDRINTGVYILEKQVLSYIPGGKPWDFGHDLFPDLLARGLPIYGYEADGYWCDVGDPAAYLRVHFDALDGRIRLPGLPKNTAARERCTLHGPAYISPGAQIAPGAHIGPYCVIGDGCRIAAGAGIKHSLLLPGAQIGENAQLRGCIVGRNSAVEADAQLFEESVVGSSSRIGRRAILPPGVKIWPEKSIAEGEHPRENIVWGSRLQERFENGALILSSPAQAARAAQACAAELGARELLIGSADSSVAQALRHAAISGALAQGVRTLDGETCALPQLRHAQRQLHADGALLVQTGSLLPLDAQGCRLGEKQQRSILKLLERQDYPCPFSRVTPPLRSAGNTAAAYVASLAAVWPEEAANAAPELLLSAPEPLCALAEQALERAGLRFHTAQEPLRPLQGQLSLQLDGQGETARIGDAQGMLSEVQRQLAVAWTALQLGEELLMLPNHFTRSIEALHPGVRYLPGEDALWLHALARHSPLQLRLHTDGLYFALCFISLLTRQGLTLDAWRRKMPAAWRSARHVDVPASAEGALLHSLYESNPGAQLGGGLRLQCEGGWAWLGPDAPGRLRIFAEGASMEASRELCDFYTGEIRRLLEQQD